MVPLTGAGEGVGDGAGAGAGDGWGEGAGAGAGDGWGEGAGAGAGAGDGWGEGAGAGAGAGEGEGLGFAGAGEGAGAGAWASGGWLRLGSDVAPGLLLWGADSLRLDAKAFSDRAACDASAALPSAISSEEALSPSRKLEPQPVRRKPLRQVPRSADVARRSVGLPGTLPSWSRAGSF